MDKSATNDPLFFYRVVHLIRAPRVVCKLCCSRASKFCLLFRRMITIDYVSSHINCSHEHVTAKLCNIIEN